MAENKKEATEELWQLVNSNFMDDELEISIDYDTCLSELLEGGAE